MFDYQITTYYVNIVARPTFFHGIMKIRIFSHLVKSPCWMEQNSKKINYQGSLMCICQTRSNCLKPKESTRKQD